MANLTIIFLTNFYGRGFAKRSAMVLSTHQKTGGKQTMNNDIRTVNIPLKSELSKDIKRLKQRRRSDNICKYSLVFVAVVGVILTSLMLAG